MRPKARTVYVIHDRTKENLRRFEELSRIIRAGYPRVTDVVSVTVTGPVSADCDALSTICLMLGLEKGLSLIEGLESYEAVFIAEDGGITVTSGAQFTPYDDMERTE